MQIFDSMNTNKRTEISINVGFIDPAFFSKFFKKEFGYSPSELR